MSFGECRIQCERTCRSRSRSWISLFGRKDLVVEEAYVCVRHSRIRECVRRITGNGVIEILDRLLKSRRRSLVPGVAAAQIQVVCLEISRSMLWFRCGRVGTELDPQCADDGSRDVILDAEDITRYALITVAPPHEAIVRPSQLGGHPQLIADPADRPTEDRIHGKRATDLSYVGLLALEAECGAACRDTNCRNLRECIRKLVRHSIREVRIRGVTTNVLEWKHGNRSDSRRSTSLCFPTAIEQEGSN